VAPHFVWPGHPANTRSSSRSFSVRSVAANAARTRALGVTLNQLAADAQIDLQVCELVHNHLRSSGTEFGSRRAQAMTQQPAKRIPQWLSDLLMIVVSLAIIGTYIIYIA
jgi:hypothetical protein